jgi:leucyl-tRNA synthetase
VGARKFLDKIEHFYNNYIENKNEDEKILSLLHKTIKKVTGDIENFAFNTAISAMMIFVNELVDYNNKNNISPLKKENLQLFLQILSPFAPYLSEELWNKSGIKKSIFKLQWPKYSTELIEDKNISLAIQINGKLRSVIEVPVDISAEDAFNLAKDNEKIIIYIEGKEIVFDSFYTEFK